MNERLEQELISWHKEHFKIDGTYEKYGGFYLENSSQLSIARHFYNLALDNVLNEVRNRFLPTVWDKHYDEWECGGDSALKSLSTFIEDLKK